MSVTRRQNFDKGQIKLKSLDFEYFGPPKIDAQIRSTMLDMK